MRILLVLLLTFRVTYAMNFVRDAEIEEYLYDISRPIFHSAGLHKGEITFYLIKENSINAFVYGGQNIFVHTGLIEHSNTPNMLQGVIAHELGHIMGAHLIKIQPQISKALTTYAIATILSIGTLASGSGNSTNNAAIASSLLGQHIAQRQILSFTRSQEAEADRYALNYLKKSQISSEGMVELFKKLTTVQKKFVKNIDEYSTTHPLSASRMAYFQNNSYEVKTTTDASLLHRHKLIQAKILAYSENHSFLTNAQNLKNTPVYNNYYLAHKYYLGSQNVQAIKIAKALLKQEPQNPFFHELASIIYTKLGETQKAYMHIKTASGLKPSNLLLKHQFAVFLIKNYTEHQKLLHAIFLLEQLKNTPEASTILYQNLQIAYHKLGMMHQYLISRIEEEVLFSKEKQKTPKIQLLIEKLENLLQEQPDPVVLSKLNRIKDLYESS